SISCFMCFIIVLFFFFFFFQAEDGIRDRNVTGVQTCALPISGRRNGLGMFNSQRLPRRAVVWSRTVTRSSSSAAGLPVSSKAGRSEERRVGKECRSRRWGEH